MHSTTPDLPERPLVIPAALAEAGAEQGVLLGLLAAERRVTVTALRKLNRSHDWQALLDEYLHAGMVVETGVAYGHPYAKGLAGERSYALTSAARPGVLWSASERGDLERIRAAGRTVFGEASWTDFATAPYLGHLRELECATTALLRRGLRDQEGALLRERLRESAHAAADVARLEVTWGSDVWQLLEQILLDARVTLDPVDAVYHWCVEHVATAPRAKTLRILAEHAFCRGDIAASKATLARLPVVERAPFVAALSVLRDEPAGASSLLDELTLNARRSGAPWPANIAALLALMALGREPAEAALLCRRVLQRISAAETPTIAGWPMLTLEKVIARHLRVLARRLAQPDAERLRLSPHHVASDAPAWEVLLSALAVQLEEAPTVTLDGWARRLLDDGVRWTEGGYRWMGRQALHLAKALRSETHRELAQLSACRPGELLICCVLDREPEWRRSLRSLERLVQTTERAEEVAARRVAWYLDMNTGELAKPAIEEYRSGMGWDRGRRLDIVELQKSRAELPPEDMTVLAALTRPPTKQHSCPEALEALVGHPRVFNGARGRQAVEVVRGHCRIETQEERGHLLIRFVPQAASEGIHVAVEGEARVVVYRVEGVAARFVRAFPQGIRIPLGQQREGLALLVRLADHVEVRSPALGALRNVPADCTPCLRISPEAGAFYVEAGVRPFGELGRFFPPGVGPSMVSLPGEEDLLDTTRDFLEEVARFRSLLADCPTLASGLEQEAKDFATETSDVATHGASFGEEALYALLTELRSSSVSYHLEWKNCRAIGLRGTLTSGQLQGTLKHIKGWYLVDGQIQLDAVNALSLAELVRMPYTKSGRFLRLPNGDFAEVETRIQRVLEQLRNVARLQARGASELRLPDVAFGAIRCLLNDADGLEASPAGLTWLARVDAAMALQPPAPLSLRATLRPYQLEGFRWLFRHSELGVGVCLADDMGLGKTLQVLAVLLTRAQDGPALVIAPTSVCSNWVAELSRFAPSLRAVEYAGKSRATQLEELAANGRRQCVVVSSYALLQQDVEKLAQVQWNTVVLDEAQFIKNPHSLRAKAAFRLPANHRLAMTGTPIENHLGDLWSIFHFLNPSLLGSLNHFQLSYAKPAEPGQDEERRARLRQLVQPFILRRLKSEVLTDLPPLTTINHEVRFTADEHLRYALLRRQIHDKLRTPSGKREHKLQVLAEITRLRRFCCHPRLVFPDAPMESSKLECFMDLVEELRDNGHRALVFSQFVDYLQLVRERLDERKLSYLYLDGSTPAEARQARVGDFQRGVADLFLISLKAGGFGINLTGADYVIHLDPWWNPAVEAQATDRAHRIGQQRPVTVYRLVAKDSIEERIVALHHEKRAIANALLDAAGGGDELDRDALLALID